MIDVLSLAEQDTRLQKASVHEQAGPCPSITCRCQTNGFRVRWDGEHWRFMCRGCWDCQEYLPDKDRKRGWGDEIDYLRHYRKMSFQEAKDFLGERITALLRRPVETQDYRSPAWQEQTQKTMEGHIERLWGEDRTALDYAHSRGLTDETIRNAGFAYSLAHDIPRLLIPSINDSTVVAIYRRDLRPDIPKDERWKDARGGTKHELYMADCLKRTKPTVLCEDAFSALSVWQEASDLVNAVATGGSGCGHDAKWIARLSRMPLVLVAFDADEAGDEDAEWWLERLPNARRLRPLAKDINDMLMDGWDVRDWLMSEVIPAAPSPEPEEPVETIQSNGHQPPSPADECGLCGSASWIITEQDQGYCKACWRSLGHHPSECEQCCDCGDFLDYADEEGRGYCETHWKEYPDEPVDERGLRTHCNCGKPATWYRDDCEPYCSQCWDGRRLTIPNVIKPHRTRDEYWQMIHTQLEQTKPGDLPYSEMVRRDTERLMSARAHMMSSYPAPAPIPKKTDVPPAPLAPRPHFDDENYDWKTLLEQVNKDIAAIPQLSHIPESPEWLYCLWSPKMQTVIPGEPPVFATRTQGQLLLRNSTSVTGYPSFCYSETLPEKHVLQ